jgi:hypothetical protein
LSASDRRGHELQFRGVLDRRDTLNSHPLAIDLWQASEAMSRESGAPSWSG